MGLQERRMLLSAAFVGTVEHAEVVISMVLAEARNVNRVTIGRPKQKG
jgi:hypothetical protein